MRGARMRILKVIHGYPPLYNAGSEVYSQLLCQGLVANQHEVHVFTREENPFIADFSLRVSHDLHEPKIKLHIINIPTEKFRYRYRHQAVDDIFNQLLDKMNPEIVHIGHLNHLSTSIINEVKKRNIPIVYTLHDYWLMCPRGQFIQRNFSKQHLWSLCDGQEDRKCAERCYAGYFSGASEEIETDTTQWADWVKRRMAHVQNIVQHIDKFIAPSKYLMQRFINDFKLSREKTCYLDYGFNLARLQNRQRMSGEPLTFGYIGTHIPAKGIQDLITAFGLLKGNCQLRIWGRPRPQNTDALHAIASLLSTEMQQRILWLPEYRNECIVKDVFNYVDCIVVPSIWVENSPLVIHEALQVRLPVITANTGGMAEYVQHEQNGLLFEHRNVKNLAAQMQRLIDHPELLTQLGTRGYLQSNNGEIPNIKSHVTEIENIYHQLLY
jgi:glycosyltransferase involved in cell wall biosynthesis